MDKQFIFDPIIYLASQGYCISRMSGIGSLHISSVKKNIDWFKTKDLNLMLRDCKRDLEIYRGKIQDCDVRMWENFIEWLETVINERMNYGK